MENLENVELGARLKTAIQNSNYSQKEIAAEIGVSGNTMTHYIKGRRIPDALMTVRIAQLCKVNIGWLLTGEGPISGTRDQDGVVTTIARRLALVEDELARINDRMFESKIVVSSERAHRFYADPTVVQAQLFQGFQRYTAIGVRHRKYNLVFRRNVTPGNPIALRTSTDVAGWVEQGAVEFHAEIGRYNAEEVSEYVTDQMCLEIIGDPGYPFDLLKQNAQHLAAIISGQKDIDPRSVRIIWNGESGFHIRGRFRAGRFVLAAAVNYQLGNLIHRHGYPRKIIDMDAYSILDKDLLAEAEGAPDFWVKTSFMKVRGTYRNAFSLNAATGSVCVPVHPNDLEQFDPNHDASIEIVLDRLSRAGSPGGRRSFGELVYAYWAGRDGIR